MPVIAISADQIRAAVIEPGAVQPVESLFAYPMGRLKRRPDATTLSAEDARKVRTRLRVALAAEAGGLLQAAFTVQGNTWEQLFAEPLPRIAGINQDLIQFSEAAQSALGFFLVRRTTRRIKWSTGICTITRPGRFEARWRMLSRRDTR